MISEESCHTEEDCFKYQPQTLWTIWSGF